MKKHQINQQQDDEPCNNHQGYDGPRDGQGNNHQGHDDPRDGQSNSHEGHDDPRDGQGNNYQGHDDPRDGQGNSHEGHDAPRDGQGNNYQGHDGQSDKQCSDHQENDRTKRYSYEDFLGIVERLRGEQGCPWDRAQTHTSLRPYMMEEAAEVLAGIRIYDVTGDAANLQEELGDVLLQVVLHSQIAREEGIFTIEDVVNGIAVKMVRRHPNVFGEVGDIHTTDDWEEIKRKEKGEKASDRRALREIPEELPALTRACKVLQKADALYEAQDTMGQAAHKLLTLAQEMEDFFLQISGERWEDTTATGRMREPVPAEQTGEPVSSDRPTSDQNERKQQAARMITESLWALCNLARCQGLVPELLLQDEIEKFIEKYEATPLNP